MTAAVVSSSTISSVSSWPPFSTGLRSSVKCNLSSPQFHITYSNPFLSFLMSPTCLPWGANTAPPAWALQGQRSCVHWQGSHQLCGWVKWVELLSRRAAATLVTATCHRVAAILLVGTALLQSGGHLTGGQSFAVPAEQRYSWEIKNMVGKKQVSSYFGSFWQVDSCHYV